MHGIIDCADCESVHITMTAGGKTVRRERPAFAFNEIFNVMFESMRTSTTATCLPRLTSSPSATRVVHGGNKFSSATVVTPRCSPTSRRCRHWRRCTTWRGCARRCATSRAFPRCRVRHGLPPVALPTFAYLYGLPYEWYKKEGIHAATASTASTPLRIAQGCRGAAASARELEIISCHPASVRRSAPSTMGVRSMTTMGMTPSDRTDHAEPFGSLDPAIMIHLMQRYGLGPRI